jgi:predicted Zn-dependent peptidase
MYRAKSNSITRSFFFLFVCLLGVAGCKNLAFLSKSDINIPVQKWTLDNGMRVLLVSRGETPVFASYWIIPVGRSQEPEGQSGLAHFFEHMMFKGTRTIGTKDSVQELELLKKQESIGNQRDALRSAPDSVQKQSLESQFQEVSQELDNLIVRNEWIQILEQHGLGAFNASTSPDSTQYYSEMPSERFELWAHVESDRLRNLVLREFYTERDVVYEERRQNFESDPQGRRWQVALKAAFGPKHPYRLSPIGTPEDIIGYTPEMARNFFNKNYSPANVVLVLVGKLDEKVVRSVVGETFGKIPVSTQDGAPTLPSIPLYPHDEYWGKLPADLTVTKPEGPASLLVMYPTPARTHNDYFPLDTISSVLCSGQSSRLYSRLIREEKLLTSIDCSTGNPDTELPHYFMFYMTPSDYSRANEAIDRLQALVGEDIVMNELELERIKKQTLSSLVWGLSGHSALASFLAQYELWYKDWSAYTKELDYIKSLNAHSLKGVAPHYFKPENRLVVRLVGEKT